MRREKLDEGGFTLLEMLTVLAVIAILATVCAPSMMGFIDQARGKSYIPEARVAYLALGQLLMDDELTYNMSSWDSQSEQWADYTYEILFEVNDEDGIKGSRLESYMDGSYTDGARVSMIGLKGARMFSMDYEVNGYKIELIEGEPARVSKLEEK